MTHFSTITALAGLPVVGHGWGLVAWFVVFGPLLLTRWYDAYRYVRCMDRRRLPR